MSIKNKLRRWGRVATVVFLAQLTVACSHFHVRDTTPAPPSHDYVDFGGFKSVNGRLTLVGKNGRPLKPTDVSFPIEDIKKIHKISQKSILFMEVEGSHYCLVKFGRQYYKFEMSHDPLTQCPE